MTPLSRWAKLLRKFFHINMGTSFEVHWTILDRRNTFFVKLCLSHARIFFSKNSPFFILTTFMQIFFVFREISWSFSARILAERSHCFFLELTRLFGVVLTIFFVKSSAHVPLRSDVRKTLSFRRFGTLHTMVSFITLIPCFFCEGLKLRRRAFAVPLFSLKFVYKTGPPLS